MGRTQDIVAEFPGIVIFHQKIPGYEVGRHQHAEHEFFLPLQGEIAVRYDSEVVSAGPGRMLYVPPGLEHSFSSASRGAGERLMWLISPETWRRHVRQVYQPSSFPINTLAKELAFHMLLHRQLQGAKYFLSALIEALGESLQSSGLERKKLASVHLSGKVTDVRIKRSMELIAEQSGSISLAAVPKESGLSSRNFSRLFLKETGLTPKDYLILCRIEKAKELLRTTKMTVTDISLEAGYASLSKFIQMFKKTTGTLPSDYRAVGMGKARGGVFQS